jgi:hypothetical protein
VRRGVAVHWFGPGGLDIEFGRHDLRPDFGGTADELVDLLAHLGRGAQEAGNPVYAAARFHFACGGRRVGGCTWPNQPKGISEVHAPMPPMPSACRAEFFSGLSTMTPRW